MQLTVICYIPSGAEAPVSKEWPWRQKILPGIYQFTIEGKSASRESAASEHFQETLSEVTKTVITLVNNYKTYIFRTVDWLCSILSKKLNF